MEGIAAILQEFRLNDPHPEELLQIYIILGPFASSRSETGQIPAVLQDSLSGQVVHIELLYLRRISLAVQV
ncbi:hypothetical protein M5W83_13450 [Paenibacillus thiaminolyticus]|uniref:Uncharacterized protein n=1 Tax=Paenibacillus thiaminolyticus TaxID=49283 RepID=A0AAP9J1S0_PANTH|nr:hypothetical protein [Paenibacillus thiaminolyticus]MCY9608148.1 hypothetical protein [Paenibacillus thiaminolyticus]MCY9624831.1 hypothetical protein [Paenibacillus thiaminolyticus]MCY9629663.1 hypothetical protein [Paenibacillus thiaminolyticus]MCY9638524.1 hypothetical protein [Paenibacillus thiaminolyticus]MCY9739243.1 hypothetical protein [Paenibacillus thiaminolyticus]